MSCLPFGPGLSTSGLGDSGDPGTLFSPQAVVSRLTDVCCPRPRNSNSFSIDISHDFHSCKQFSFWHCCSNEVWSAKSASTAHGLYARYKYFLDVSDARISRSSDVSGHACDLMSKLVRSSCYRESSNSNLVGRTCRVPGNVYIFQVCDFLNGLRLWKTIGIRLARSHGRVGRVWSTVM